MPMDLWKLKLICGFVIFVLTMIPSVIPFKIFSIRWGKIRVLCRKKGKAGVEEGGNPRKKKDGKEEDANEGAVNENVVGHMMCFGGGVFLGTYLTHMSVEVLEILSETYINDIDYPLPALITAIGFFLVLTIDQIVGSWRSFTRKRKKQRKLAADQAANQAVEEEVNEGVNEIINERTIETSESRINLGSGVSEGVEVEVDDNENTQVDLGEEIKSEKPHNHHGGMSDEEVAEMEELHRHTHATHSIILVLALSFHHIFEGMAIGLQDHFDNVWLLTLSVLIHEIVIFFSIGLQFYKSDKSLSIKVGIILFITALILPIGVFIGIGISVAPEHDSSTNQVVNGVLQAIATGTFLYVTFFEILFEELGGQKATLTRVFATILGFTLMALLALIPNGVEEVLHGNLTTDAFFTTMGP